MTGRIRHPGPPVPDRITSARGHARRRSVTLPAGATLMGAVADAMGAAGCDSGVMVLDGLRLGAHAYVMPGPSPDADHAAWYSATHRGEGARLDHATATVGRRNGAWWLHCHAVWHGPHGAVCGHLLPDDVQVAEDATVTLHAFDGGGFEVRRDRETNFDIFHTTGGRAAGNALITRIAPHEDAHAALVTLAREAGFARAEVLGIGSLIGARFESGPSMVSPISEILITPGATWAGGALHLPVHCVDPAGGQFAGVLVPGGGPVCVTFEAMIIESA